MRTPTNIPKTPMGETEQDSFFESKEKFQQQLQDIFQTILKLTRPDQFATVSIDGVQPVPHH